MKRIFTLALQGLAAVLPVALTVYLVYWLLHTMESVAGEVLLMLIPQAWYFQGMGVLSAFLALVLIGILVKVYVIRHLIRMGEALLSRTPLIKSVFGAIQDFMRMFAPGERQNAESVVLVEIQDDAHLIGFITGRRTAADLFPCSEDEMVAVYLPMSYQIGGYTLYIPSRRLKPLDISVEEGMRIALTGGIQGGRKSP